MRSTRTFGGQPSTFSSPEITFGPIVLQDMIRGASRDGQFQTIKTETYGENLSWRPD